MDIDPQDPVGVTQIWALGISIGGILTAKAEVLTMRGLWKREVTEHGKLDALATGIFHGVLKNIELQTDHRKSELIEQVKNEISSSESKELSIRFALDMFRNNHTGRMYGTIGCHGYKAPRSRLFSRILLPLDWKSFQRASFAVDADNSVIVFDFGSSFQTNKHGNHVTKEGEQLAVTYARHWGSQTLPNNDNTNCKVNRKILGLVPLWHESWLVERAGFLTIKVTDEDIHNIRRMPLEVIKVSNIGFYKHQIYNHVLIQL